MAFLWGIVMLSTVVLRPFWLALVPFVPACPFRSLTGVPCPTCGTTHAAIAMLHGRIGAALAANPLAAAAGLAFLAGGLIAPLWVALRLPVPEIPAPLPRWVRALILAALAASWMYVIATTT